MLNAKPSKMLQTWQRAARQYKPAWLALRRHPYPEQFSDQFNLPRFEGKPRLYLMATTPRCGSHFLGHALHAAEQFGFPLEYLNRMNLDIWRAQLKTPSDAAALDALFRIRTSPSGWFGLKAHWGQYDEFADKGVFEARGGFEKAIWIYRRDLLAQSISRATAEQTGQWISGAKRRRDPIYDANRIIRNARYIQRQNKNWQVFFADQFKLPVLTIAYEDLLADQATHFQQIGRFLDPNLAVAPTTPEKTRKQADGISHEWHSRFAAEADDVHAWILEPQHF